MTATVDVSQRGITTLGQAIAWATNVRDAESDTAAGGLFDSIAVFLKDWIAPALLVNEDAITELFHALGYDRAVRITAWLAQRANDPAAARFWSRMNGFYRLAREVAAG